MTATTCKVWGCYRPVANSKYSKLCKRHRELNQHNGHPTFKPPALAKHHATYNQELSIAVRSGKQWFTRVDLTHYEKSFGRLLDDAEQLKPLSQYRRLGDLPERTQLLYLLKGSVENVGRHETMKQWLVVYLAADFKRRLFPNEKTFAVFVCRKSLKFRVKIPMHLTKSGNKKYYKLNAKRAVKMLRILEPIFQLAFMAHENAVMWFRYYNCKLHISNQRKQFMKEKHENNPNYASSLTKLRIIKSIERRYLGG